MVWLPVLALIAAAGALLQVAGGWTVLAMVVTYLALDIRAARAGAPRPSDVSRAEDVALVACALIGGCALGLAGGFGEPMAGIWLLALVASCLAVTALVRRTQSTRI